MMALILAGGQGTRLAPLTVSIPKPLMPVGEMPIVEIVIRQLNAGGIDRVVLALGHMAHFFTPFIDRWRTEGMRIECCYEETPLGTAGAIRLVDDLDDDFLVMNGDLLTTLDFGSLVRAHRARAAWGTIAVATREVRIDYGVVRAGEDGLLSGYDEKPTLTYDVSMGINVLSRRAVDLIPPGKHFDVPDLMLAIRTAGKPVFCHRSGCYWQDIGRLDDLQQATADFAENRSRFLPSVP